jgi:hypothetical protein
MLSRSLTGIRASLVTAAFMLTCALWFDIAVRARPILNAVWRGRTDAIRSSYAGVFAVNMLISSLQIFLADRFVFSCPRQEVRHLRAPT